MRIWCYLGILLSLVVSGRRASSVESTESCRYLSLKCSYRGGCGATLRSYLLECNDLIKNKTEVCSESCKYTLIGLTSTPEGKSMLDCDCGSDEDCLNSRIRLETCSKDSVLYANRQDTVVSCTEAKWICMSDSECSKALEYYNIFCKSMFRGSKCTARCRNSIRILKKQSKAAKLENCLCERDEVQGYKCEDIKSNMRDLCLMDDDTEEMEDDENNMRKDITTMGPIKISVNEEEEEEKDISITWTTEEINVIDSNDITEKPPPEDAKESPSNSPILSPPFVTLFTLYTISVIAITL
eukprot:TRINITY_DN2757_c0_g1_i1.p1 TRINITY_DN2757_c0_g1~~TRINITY_DN2757_c0_g1_i1.p1  ORF type:complete len:298 (+),score=72.95 TRINITY_DN2757_c0_g1_i1:100-993(+)